MAKKQKSRGSNKNAVVAEDVRRNAMLGSLAVVGVVLTAGLLVVASTKSNLPYCGVGSDCDVVQNSRWSTLFGIPISLWGLLLYTSIAVAAWRANKPRTRWRVAILLGTVGFAVSLYLNGISLFVIQSMCLYCVASFVLITLIYLLGWRAEGLGGFASWRVGSSFFAVAMVIVMHFYYAGVFSAAAGPEDPYLRSLAEHLSASEAKFYGAFWCPHCQQQKQVFGSSAHRLPYVECSPNGQGGARSTECLSADIRNYPTWIIAGRRLERILTPALLARYSDFDAIEDPASPTTDSGE